ncbi:MAG: hypothetical protein Devi2KO_00880 [Devosia indica]
MSVCAGERRPRKAEGRAEDREAGQLESGGNPFPYPDNREVAEPLQASGSEEESGPLATTKARYDLRSGIARLLKPADGSRGPATCGCGFSAFNSEAVAVHMSMGDRRASVSGVYRCDSISACPVCTVRRAREVEERLLKASKACLKMGGSVWAMTITVQRKREQSLRVMKDGATGALRKARQGSGWVKPSIAAGFMGLTTTTECPWSLRTGHGLHFHIFGFFDHRDFNRAKAHCELLITRYLDELDSVGLVGDRKAQEMHMCADTDSAAAYAAKASAELAHGWVKESRKGDSVHPFAVAARACLKDEDGNPVQVPGLENVSPDQAAAVFAEYAAVFSGIRQGLISPALASKLKIKDEDEATPEDAEQRFEDEKPVVGTVGPGLWNKLMTKALAGTFLAKVEDEVCRDPDTGAVEGWAGVIEWACDAVGQARPVDADRELYGDESPGPTVEEMAAWTPIRHPPVRVTVGQVWAEAQELSGLTISHHAAFVGRVMTHVPAAIEAIRTRIEAKGREADMPDEAEVWASVMERMAA